MSPLTMFGGFLVLTAAVGSLFPETALSPRQHGKLLLGVSVTGFGCMVLGAVLVSVR